MAERIENTVVLIVWRCLCRILLNKRPHLNECTPAPSDGIFCQKSRSTISAFCCSRKTSEVCRRCSWVVPSTYVVLFSSRWMESSHLHMPSGIALSVLMPPSTSVPSANTFLVPQSHPRFSLFDIVTARWC